MMKIASAVLFVATVATLATAAATDLDLTADQWWAKDTRAGAAGRPFITDLSVTLADGTTEDIISGQSKPSDLKPKNGQLTAVVTPVNLCGTPGEVTALGRDAMVQGPRGGSGPGDGNKKPKMPLPPPCMKSPDQAFIHVGCVRDASANDGTVDLSSTTNGCNKYKDAIVDVSVDLQTWNEMLQWSWVNTAELSRYEFDEKKGTLRFRTKVVETPLLNPDELTADASCDAKKPAPCNIKKSAGEYVGTRVLMTFADPKTALARSRGGSGHGTTIANLPYAVFASSAAFVSGLWIETKTVDGREIRSVKTGAAGPHYKSDGTLNKGNMMAILPKQSYKNVWPSFTGAAISAMKKDSDKINFGPVAGTKSADSVTVGVEGRGKLGTTALVFRMSGQTFSTPTYDIAVDVGAAKPPVPAPPAGGSTPSTPSTGGSTPSTGGSTPFTGGSTGSGSTGDSSSTGAKTAAAAGSSSAAVIAGAVVGAVAAVALIGLITTWALGAGPFATKLPAKIVEEEMREPTSPEPVSSNMMSPAETAVAVPAESA